MLIGNLPVFPPTDLPMMAVGGYRRHRTGMRPDGVAGTTSSGVVVPWSFSSSTACLAGVAAITVFLADDSVIIREGVRAMLARDPDVEVVGVADDYDGLVAGASAAEPDVVVSDIRMPPTFQREGIDAAKEIRKRHPGTGIVILSQFDDPDYAVSLLSEGSAGYAYLLKDRIAEGDQLARAIREVATGGSMLDPVIVSALMNPVRRTGGLSAEDEQLLEHVAAGRTIKAIAGAERSTAAAVEARVERLFLQLAEGVSTGEAGALDRLRRLHQAIVEREEQGETLSRLLPTGIAEKLLAGGHGVGETERLDVTVLMSDIRGYTSIAEHADPAVLAQQLNRHRAEMNRAILGAGGTVMQYVGDAVMAVFGAPEASDDHAARALDAAGAMHAAQHAVNAEWAAEQRSPFGLGIGLSTGVVAAALLGSEERVEYTLVGDAVNLCQRLQQFAEPGQTVLSEATWQALAIPPAEAEKLEPQFVKGRDSPVVAYRI
jgi:class 3 adenylate cyclase/DNA-binding NarL/FixJ family response regulator